MSGEGVFCVFLADLESEGEIVVVEAREGEGKGGTDNGGDGSQGYIWREK